MNREAANDYPVHPLIKQRYSPLVFSEKAVDPAALYSLFEAARWAPSSFNDQPWAFVVARREETEAYARLYDGLVPGNQDWAGTAPVLIITFARQHFRTVDEENPHALYDLGVAVSQLSFQATSMGLSLRSMAGIRSDVLQSALQVPDAFRAVTAIALGYAGDHASLTGRLAKRAQQPRTRLPQTAFVFSGQFDISS